MPRYRSFYAVTRDLHLYLGLFISPFVLVFAISVFFLVHSFVPGAVHGSATTRSVADVSIPAGIESLAGRERIDALRGLLNAIGVRGEVGFIQHFPKDHRLVIPVTVPGRETTVVVDLPLRRATVTQRTTGMWDGLIALHKLPGPHLANIRMNWPYIRLWSWLADATVYVFLFLSISGIYLWYVLRAERRIGYVMLGAGTLTFLGIVYALAS
jgi:hypothetical protein